jgi:hypothetical protein
MKRLLRTTVASLALAALTFAVSGAPAPPSPEVQTPAGPAIPELVTLEAAYARDVHDKVDAPREAAMQRLNESYRVTLESTFKKTAAQGLLDETVALQDELKRFTADQKVPESDEPGVHPSVAKLRSFWRAEAARIAKVRDATLQPLTAGHVANLRTLARELTKALKIDEARVVQAKAAAFSAPAVAPAATPPPVAAVPPPAPVASPSSPPASGDLPVIPGARPAFRVELYATAVRGATVFINDKEVLKDVGSTALSHKQVALKEGDIIAVRNPDPNLANNMLYIAGVAGTGQFLFETSEDWRCYIPKDHAKDQFLPFVVRCAFKTPYYRGTPPIHNGIRDDSGPKLPNYCYHVVTKEDLLPKKLASIPNPAIILSAPLLGKTIRIKTAKGGAEGVQGTDQLMIGDFDPKAPKAGVFKVAKGEEVGNIVFESVEKPGFFIRAQDGKLRLAKGREKHGEFELMPPNESDQGVSVLSITSLYFWQINDKRELVHGGYRPPSAFFFLEEVAVK